VAPEIGRAKAALNSTCSSEAIESFKTMERAYDAVSLGPKTFEHVDDPPATCLRGHR
jgi:hypothetical protein